jgi:hypothetical protein
LQEEYGIKREPADSHSCETCVADLVQLLLLQLCCLLALMSS